jgi:hypothetical protein
MPVQEKSKKNGPSEDKMPENINPMQKQAVYAEGKKAFADGKRRGYNQYRIKNRELASIWWNGWDQAKNDSEKDKPNKANTRTHGILS